MRKAMADAEVGDDVFGEDPTVNSLEERVAGIFGHESGLFCPSGTMTNQIGVNVHTRPGDEVICDEGAHIYRYEGGGVMATSGCSVKLLHGDRGRFTAEQVEGAINDTSAHYLARTRLVNIENTNNRGGGSVWDLKEVDRIRTVCDRKGLAMHLDGARIFNALQVSGDDAASWGKRFDSVSVCLSKGIGAPAGSLLLGSKELIALARRVRKRLGGGMRQAGVLAAACHFALDHDLPLLREDHRRAQIIQKALDAHPAVRSILPVQTNIIIFTLAEEKFQPFLDHLKKNHITAAIFGPSTLRMVTHLDISDADIERVIEVINSFDP
jgi:threonine aldolase